VVTDGAQAAVNLSTITNTLSTGTLGTSFGPQTFGEAGLDLTAVADAVQYPNTACEFFRQVTVKSRKSSSIAAELADYVHAQDVVARSCETPGGTGGGGTGGGGTGGGGTGGGGTGGGGGGTPPGDTTAPDAPSFDGAINGATSCSGNIVLGGLAEPNSVVTVYDGTAPVSDFAVADALGAWTLTISGAATGAHVYTAEATDSSGNTSGRTAPATVTVGGCAPGQSGTPGVDPGPPVPGGGSTGDGTGSGSGSGTTDPGATPPTGSSDPAPVVAGQPTGTSSPLGAIAADTGALDGFLLGNHPATASGCQLKTFKAYVRRKSGVRKVVFRVDGKQVAVDRKPDKKGQFIGVIKPSKLKAGPHILTGTIIFKAKGHKPKVLTLRFRKCDQCQSRRAITVHPRGLHKGERAVSAKIYLNGKLYRSVKGAKKLGAKIVLKGMSKGVQKVRIVAKTNQGRTIVDHRKFKTCTKKTASTKKKT
jgi:hypothetical protein